MHKVAKRTVKPELYSIIGCLTGAVTATILPVIDDFIEKNCSAKGQLIMKCLFGVIVSTKKPTKILQGFPP